MTQSKPFYIVGTKSKRPDSTCTIYVDGSAESDFRWGVDVELSHWIPNRTEDRYKAGTSTEICFNFLEAHPSYDYDLVINNHLDIDGLLSVFVMSYPTLALKHRDVICMAAKIGDFWAWGTGKGLNLFQELTHLFMQLNKDKTDAQTAYEKCFELTLQILKRTESKSKAQSILEDQFSLIEAGHIQREEVNDLLASYFVPKDISKGQVQGFLECAEINEPISKRLAFWPQVRNRLDEQKVQLVAVEAEEGLYYDLWFPGYLWADTKGLWRPPGFAIPADFREAYLIEWPALSQAIKVLNRIETGSCIWTLFPSLYIFDQKNPRSFPIVASTLGSGQERGVSHLSVEIVNRILEKVF